VCEFWFQPAGARPYRQLPVLAGQMLF
jgi:hypothetical protein